MPLRLAIAMFNKMPLELQNWVRQHGWRTEFRVEMNTPIDHVRLLQTALDEGLIERKANNYARTGLGENIYNANMIHMDYDLYDADTGDKLFVWVERHDEQANKVFEVGPRPGKGCCWFYDAAGVPLPEGQIITDTPPPRLTNVRPLASDIERHEAETAADYADYADYGMF